jgi:hypothetical protein
VRHRHSGMELFEMFRQTVGRQYFSTWGSNGSIFPRDVMRGCR